MASMGDIREKFGFVNPGKVEEYLGQHPQLIDPLIMAVPVIKRHLPEAGTPQLKHMDLGCLDGELMLLIPLPANSDPAGCRQRLSLIDHGWWVPLSANVKSILLADIRWDAHPASNALPGVDLDCE